MVVSRTVSVVVFVRGGEKRLKAKEHHAWLERKHGVMQVGSM
jgi:hypothetical protein